MPQGVGVRLPERPLSLLSLTDFLIALDGRDVDNYPLISSPQNPKLKEAVSLRESRQRRKTGTFLIDGRDLLCKALRAGFRIDQLFLSDRFSDLSLVHTLQESGCEIYRLAPAAMGKLQYGERDVDAIGVARYADTGLQSLTKRIAAKRTTGAFQSKTYLVLDRMEKPGNLGAALRTADGAGVRGVLLSDPICDLWNPNAVRSSLGALFTVPIATGTEQEITAWLCERGATIFTARVEGSAPYAEADFRSEHAIVIGNEAEGLQQRWSGANCLAVSVPMLGAIDSLNASVTTAVLAYEALRQQTGSENKGGN